MVQRLQWWKNKGLKKKTLSWRRYLPSNFKKNFEKFRIGESNPGRLGESEKSQPLDQSGILRMMALIKYM